MDQRSEVTGQGEERSALTIEQIAALQRLKRGCVDNPMLTVPLREIVRALRNEVDLTLREALSITPSMAVFMAKITVASACLILELSPAQAREAAELMLSDYEETR